MNEETCSLTGVIDWAEAESCPFDLNLHRVQTLMTEAGSFIFGMVGSASRTTTACKASSGKRLRAKFIKTARAMGLLLSMGFTSRLGDGAVQYALAAQFLFVHQSSDADGEN